MLKATADLWVRTKRPTVRTLTEYREVIGTLINDNKGRLVGSPGDNILAEFASVVDSLRCALDIQQEIKSRNSELPENRRMNFRIGINLGDVIEEKDRIYGDGVNIAARLENLQKKAEFAFRVLLMIKSKINFLSGTNTMASRQSKIYQSRCGSIVF